jgi:preprotein translocase subunit SecF
MSDITQGHQTADIPADAIAAATPQREPRVRKLNIIGRRNLFFAISLIVIVPGIISMATQGFLLGIDFAGGTEFTVAFASQPSVAQVEQAVASETVHGQNIDGSVIQTDRGVFIIRAKPMLPAEQKVVVDDLARKLGTTIDVRQVLEVGPTIAGEAIQFALLAVVLASVAILFLLAIRFHNLPGGWRAGFQFGGSALLALLHDVFLLTGIFSIMGKVLHWRIGEIDSFFVVAVLTVVGFSVHDTIVVFDRIRENLRVSQRLSFEQVVNLSIMQTAARSLITSFTVVLVLVAILVAGGSTQKGLALALLIGIVSGAYSSIFNAAPLLVVWRRFQPLR